MTQEELKELVLDFRKYLAYTWDHLSLPKPTKIQLEMASYLAEGQSRKILEGYRGVGKSWITSAFVTWRLLRNPDIKILVVSASKMRADEFSQFTLRLIKEMPVLEHLTPRSDQRQSLMAFDVDGAQLSHAPSVKSLGITSQLTGSRADLIIADDIETATNSATEIQRAKLMQSASEFEALLTPKPDSQIIKLGTPQTAESIYNRYREKGYATRIWPSRYPGNIEIYQGSLAPTLVKDLEDGIAMIGDPTDPKRFDDAELLQREASYGKSNFMLQFMLDTTLSDAEKYPLKTRDLITMGLDSERGPISCSWSGDPSNALKNIANVGFTGDTFQRPMYVANEFAKYEGSLMAIDPSGMGSDELAYAIVNHLHGKLYVLDVQGMQGGYSEDNLRRLARVAKQYQVGMILIENNFGQGMFASLLRPILKSIHPCGIEEIRSHSQKEKRIIETMEPVMNQHRLVINQTVIDNDLKVAMVDPKNLAYSLIYQLTHMTKDRGSLQHDDRIDALSMAVEYWMESMGRDEQDSVDAYKDELLEKTLEEWIDSNSDSKWFSVNKDTGF